MVAPSPRRGFRQREGATEIVDLPPVEPAHGARPEPEQRIVVGLAVHHHGPIPEARPRRACAASLVNGRRVGRERPLTLAPLPITRRHDRWIGESARAAVELLDRLDLS